MSDSLRAVRRFGARTRLIKLGRLGALGVLVSMPLVGLTTLAPGVGQSLPNAGALGPPPTVPPVTTYTMNCTVPLIGSLPLQVSIFATAPGSTHPGNQVSLHAVRSTVAIPASLVNLALAFHITSLSGTITTVDFNATNATPSTINSTPTPINFGPIPLTENQPATFTVPTTPQTVGPWTAGTGSSVVFTPGAVDLTVLLPISCTPSSPAPLATTVIR